MKTTNETPPPRLDIVNTVLSDLDREAIEALRRIKPFLPRAQGISITEACIDSEEREFFMRKLIDMDKIISAMPVTYQTRGAGDEAVIHLHYFNANSDFYITEKDIDGGVLQAYGYVILNGDDMNAETGYVNIEELCRARGGGLVELDLHWNCATTIQQIKDQRRPKFASNDKIDDDGPGIPEL